MKRDTTNFKMISIVQICNPRICFKKFAAIWFNNPSKTTIFWKKRNEWKTSRISLAVEWMEIKKWKLFDWNDPDETWCFLRGWRSTLRRICRRLAFSVTSKNNITPWLFTHSPIENWDEIKSFLWATAADVAQQNAP